MRIKRAYFKDKNGARDILAKQIIKFTKNTGARGGVVGLSGGIDSTTVAYLCKYAFDKFNKENPTEEPLKLIGVIMPSKANSSKDAEDGIRVAEKLGIEYKTISIEEIAQGFIDKLPEVESEFDKGNLYSEVRAIILSRVAGVNNLRVMGTGNWDEDYVLGYFTKRGDGAVDNNILGSIPKRLVRELAEFLGAPEDLVKKVPTAGLWENQTDEDELGYSYEKAEIIQNGFDQGFDTEEIIKETGIKEGVVLDVAKRHNVNEHKRNVPPVGEIDLDFYEIDWRNIDDKK